MQLQSKQMIWNKQNKHNSLIASSGPAPVGLSVDYTKRHDSGAEVSHEASFMTFDLKNTSQFWSSLEDVSSSNGRVKLWSTFLKEDIKFLFEEMLFGMFALNLPILLNSGFLGLSLKGYRHLCLVHYQVSDGAERSLSCCVWSKMFNFQHRTWSSTGYLDLQEKYQWHCRASPRPPLECF